MKALRHAVAKDYDRMAEDAESYGHDVELKKILRETDPIPCRQQTYPNWHTHEARHSLRQDIAEGKHKAMKPKELHETRTEYQQFPLDVFRHHIYQEAEREERQKARFDKKKIRAMMLKPRETVMPPEDAKVVLTGGDVPIRYATQQPNLEATLDAEDYLEDLRLEKTAAARKEKAKAKAQQKRQQQQQTQQTTASPSEEKRQQQEERKRRSSNRNNKQQVAEAT